MNAGAILPMLLIHHATHRGFRYPPSSLSGLADCLAAGAQIVEMDITPLADGDFALVHDSTLEAASDGQGSVAAATAAQVRGLHLRWRGALTSEPAGLLSQAVELLAGCAATQELQLDLKPHAPLTDAVLERLLRWVEPVKRRVRVTSTADWAIRRLAALDPELAVGFDPLLYLDVERGDGGDGGTPPLRMGAYDYLDEHPLGTQRWGPPADYLAARAEALWAQAPAGMWYIRGALLARALDDGFDWIAWLHGRGAQVAAWTLDADKPHQLDLAQRLAELGVDRITTNDAPRLAEALGI
ncbi:MAG: glycerophosphodiester phosphodiesterase family protein [Chloroflexi bacterium]|nr:glycerophosphodiester phosphodiesterase family protein [Chloroflexota bacterium]